eukprot:c18976_g1_i1.p1 GENE.c18976_g1_i1~~c18976_g1_i1.p1  ORF type:complete len:664 (+),score=172.76 c18976_g1_i1:90-2081(+)
MSTDHIEIVIAPHARSRVIADEYHEHAIHQHHENHAELEHPEAPDHGDHNSLLRIMSCPVEQDLVPAVLTWKDLVIKSAKGNKTLLQGSGMINGGLWALMGPSGSGKSTLLNVLACRLDPTCTVTGEFRLNGQKYTNTELKKVAGYVMQDDLLSAFLTVQETLDYTATLRLSDCAPDVRKQRVDYVIRQVGLDHCRHVIVGNALRKGISGGERKRLCVAQELLLQPSLLFLDEPTSGLDSATALDLIRTLQHLSRTVCTVVCSIHQPQSSIFNLFDSIVLVKSGRVVFFGSVRRALLTFQAAGFPVPPLTNPADHIIDVLSAENPQEDDRKLQAHLEADAQSSLQKWQERQQDNSSRLMEKFEAPHIDLEYGAEKPLIQTRGRVSWGKQFQTLSHRNFKELLRKRDLIFTNVVQTVVIAVLIGTVFLQIGDDQKSLSRRNSLLFFCCVNQAIFGCESVINSFPSDRALSLRERASGAYTASAYFVSKSLVDSLPHFLYPTIFSAIVYHLVGLRGDDPSHFFTFLLFMILCNLSATSAALMISAVCVTMERSVAVLPMFFEMSRLFAGFFLTPANLPTYFVWLDALSFIKYSFTGVSLNEWGGLKLTCKPGQLRDGVCPMTNGDKYIEREGFDYINVGGCVAFLIGYIFVTRFFAFLAIRYLKH